MLIMSLTLFMLFVISLGFDCPEDCLYRERIGDTLCDESCMSLACNYDSLVDSSSVHTIFERSDCRLSCLESCGLSSLGDGVCDVECNTYQCGWDLGDCGYCASGCLESQLGNSSCDVECDSIACNWDGQDCGDCSSGCFSEMLSNDQCDEECATLPCLFDNGKCGCASGCRVEDYGLCKNECLVPSCNFDPTCTCGEDCNHKLIRLVATYYHIIHYTYDLLEIINGQCPVNLGCDQKVATIDNICNNENCHEENCIDDYFGSCIKNEGCKTDCMRCTINDWACLECKPYMVNFSGFCYNSCPRGYPTMKLCFYEEPCTAENIFRLCVDEITNYDTTTQENPEVFIVDPNYIVEEGIDTNVNYLSEALEYGWKNYTTIKLNGDMHLMHQYSQGEPRQYIYMHMVIESDSMTTVKLMSPRIQFPTTFLSLTLRNIVFDGSQALNNDCNSQTCMYCPFYSYDQYAYYDDRGQLISDPSLYNIQQCSDLTTSVLLSGNFNLTIENCRFTNIKFNPSAIIHIRNNNVSIKDTSFYNLIASSVIMFEGKDYDFSLEGGSVRYINNGFEYFDGMEQSPFLKIESSNWAFIKNVMFDKNAVMCDIDFMCDNLIEIKDSFKTEIENCEFDTNIVTNSLISIDLSSFQLGQISTDDQGTCIECKDYNIVLFNNTFTNSVVLRSALSIEFASYTPNINIYRNSFYNLVGQSSAISITKSHLPSTTDIQGGEYFYTLNGQKQTVILDPKSFQLSHNSFNRTIFDSVLYLSQLPNVLIYNETLSIPTNRKDPNSILSLYSQDPLTYLSTSIDKFQQVQYGSFVKSFRLTNFKFQNIRIEDLKCAEDYCLIDSQQLLGDITVRSFSVSSLESSFMRLTSSYEGSLNITDIDIRNVTATETSVTLSDFQNIQISNLNFQDVMCQEFGALFIENSVQTNIQHLQMTNCSSSRGSGGGITIKISSTIAENSLNIEESSFESCSAFSNAGALYLQGDNGNDFPLTFTIQSSTFTNNFARRSGSTLFVSSSVYLSESSQVRNCTFDRNYVQIRGNLMFEQTQGSVSITSSLFRDNTSLTKGSSIYYSTLIASTLSLDSCSFSENEGESVVFVESYQNKNTLNTNNCYFRNNQGASLHLTLSFWNDSGSTFASNQNNVGGSGFVLENSSQAQCLRTSFSDNEASDGGSGEVLSYSSFSGVSCSFLNNRASSKGGALFLEQDSCLNLEDCFLMGNTASTGSAVYISSSPNKISKIAGSTIKDNNSTKESAVFVERSSIEIVYSEVSGNKGSKGSGGAVLIDSRGEIRSSTFKDQQSTEGNGGGLSCTDCLSLNIENSTFENLENPAGGAIYITSQSISTSSISNSTFRYNSASTGGSIYAENANTTISNSVFYGNKAISVSFDPTVSSISEGKGGGIFHSCEDSCLLSLNSTSFYMNTATYNGGAIAWESAEPAIENSNFDSNSAHYGDDISSFAVRIMKLDDNSNIVPYSRLLTSVIGSLEDVPSGQRIANISFAVVDNSDNIVNTENSHTITISGKDGVKVSGTSKLKVNQGIVTFNDLIISATPGTSVNISISSEEMPEVLLEASLRDCYKGEATIGVECFRCLSETYTFSPSDTKCNSCPSNAKCYGGVDMVPRPGHWKSRADSAIIWKCPNADACLGGLKDENDTISYLGRCERGYEGNMCQSCVEGYSHITPNVCTECPAKIYNAIILVIVCLVLVCSVILIVKISMRSAEKEGRINSLFIKIMINHLQMTVLIGAFNLEWPYMATIFFTIFSVTSTASGITMSLDCLIENEESGYFIKLSVISIVPLAFAALLSFIWFLVSLIKKNWKYLREELFVSMVVLLFIMHPILINKVFNSINCLEIEDGEYWLANTLDIPCWDDDHSFYVLAVTLPSIIVWGIAMPGLCFGFLFKKRRFLNELQNKRTLGFLYSGYRNHAYFWDFVIMFRKIMIICCLVLSTVISARIQAILLFIILLASCALQGSYSPYRDDKFNRMEMLSLIICIVMVICGMFYLTEDFNETTELLMFLLILGLNIYFLILWGFKAFPVVKDAISALYWARRNFQKRYSVSMSSSNRNNSIVTPSTANERDSVSGNYSLHEVFMFRVREMNGARRNQISPIYEASHESLSDCED